MLPTYKKRRLPSPDVFACIKDRIIIFADSKEDINTGRVIKVFSETHAQFPH